MHGVILDADSLGTDIDIEPVTSLLDTWDVHPYTSVEQVGDRIRNATVVLSNKIRLDDAVMKQSPELRYISVMATGTNNVDLAAARSLNINVSNAVGYATPSVVQHTLSLILCLARSIPQYLNEVKAGKWQESEVFCLLNHPMMEINGKTLGIVGYGELGKGVATAASALGMNLLISERPGHKGQKPREGRCEFETLLAESDFISLHCPLTEETQHLINAETLSKTKLGAFLINTARGGLVDSHALLASLNSGHLAGAAIDVLDVEPAATDEPLVTELPNLLLTPHNAWGAVESRIRLVTQMKENIEGFLGGTPPRVVK